MAAVAISNSKEEPSTASAQHFGFVRGFDHGLAQLAVRIFARSRVDIGSTWVILDSRGCGGAKYDVTIGTTALRRALRVGFGAGFRQPLLSSLHFSIAGRLKSALQKRPIQKYKTPSSLAVLGVSFSFA